LRAAKELIKPGMTTAALDKIIADTIAANGCLPAFKGYRGFQHASCISINEEVVHSIPADDQFIKMGDIVSIDTGAISDGYYSDTAITLIIGEVGGKKQQLVRKTEAALKAGIKAAQAGATIGDISKAIGRVGGSGVIKGYTGHGLGKTLHEFPQVPNEVMGYERMDSLPFNTVLEVGMVLAIEPMIALGNGATMVLDDGWTVVTVDGSVAAHFEHTIMITAFGPVILTEDK
jgi:methionyl aminopeptidase